MASEPAVFNRAAAEEFTETLEEIVRLRAVGVIQKARIRELEAENENLRELVDGLEADLDLADSQPPTKRQEKSW